MIYYNINVKISFAMIILMANNSIWSQEKVEIEGAIVISNSNAEDPKSGTIRWTGTDFEGWNGIYWVSLTSNPIDSVQDEDGNFYRTLIIGEQTWMIDNLRTTKFNDGTDIQKVSSDWWSITSPAYTWYNDDSIAYAEPFGALYNYFVISDPKNICPSGWENSYSRRLAISTSRT